MPLSLFSTLKNAGIEENEAKQSARILENDFGHVWSSEDEKDDERLRQKYFASAKKKRRLCNHSKEISERNEKTVLI